MTEGISINKDRDIVGWTASDIVVDTTWRFELSPQAMQDLEAYLDHLSAIQDQEDFKSVSSVPDSVRAVFAAMFQQTARGFGFAILHGVPVHHSSSILSSLMYAFASTIGIVMPQNTAGDRIVGVTNEGGGDGRKELRGYQSRVALPFHCDATDMIALMCVRAAKTGGDNALVSSLAIYHALKKNHPETIPILEQGFPYRFSEAAIRSTDRVPVFSKTNGDLSCRYLRHFIQAAGDITQEQNAALDTFDNLAGDPHMMTTLRMEPGDILLMNNHTVLHSRTSFEDHDGTDQRRLLLRAWMNNPNIRAVDPRIIAQSLRFGS